MVDEYDGKPDDAYDEIALGAMFVSCSVRLTKDQGFMIKSLVQDMYPHTFPHYCQKVGISTPNFYNTLNGERPCTLEFLNKLLSGIQYEAIVLNPEIIIRELQIGGIVPDVDSATLENELLSRELEEPDILDSSL